MEEFEEIGVVSSSSPSTSSSSQNSEFDGCIAPGTKVLLKGKIWMEMDNALVLNIGWRGRNFAGTLIKVDDPDCWGPQKLRNSPPNRKKKKIYKTYKKFNTFGEYSKRKGVRQPGMYSLKYPRSFVDTSNIVESKLRYGRDKKVAAYSSCPSSPRSSESSRTDPFYSSVSDFSSEVNSIGLKRSTSFSLNQSQKFSTNSLELPAQHHTINDFTQCNEIGSSTKICNDSFETFKNKQSLQDESVDSPMQSLKNNQNTKKNLISSLPMKSSKRKGLKMPALVPFVDVNFCKIYNSNDTGAANNFSGAVSCDINNNMEKVDQDQTIEIKSTTWGVYDNMKSEKLLPMYCSDPEKIYTTLENCDTKYLQPNSPIASDEQSMKSSQFLFSPLQDQEESGHNV